MTVPLIVAVVLLTLGQIAMLKYLSKAREDIETLFARGQATPETTDPRDAAASAVDRHVQDFHAKR